MSHRVGNTLRLVKEVEDLNFTDRRMGGGAIDNHIVEAPRITFNDPENQDYSLSTESSCIDAGVDVSLAVYNGPQTDWEGRERPRRGSSCPGGIE